MQTTLEIRHFHMFCGAGGGAKGFNKGSARVGSLQAKFRCLGGIDVDRAAIRDFQRLSGVPGTVMDLMDRDQFRAFHGTEPPRDWREASTDDIHRAAGNERPHIVFLSAPCKGFSGLLSETKSRSDKYRALNRLTLRGVWLMLEAWADDPPELVLFENVPRIATRGRYLLDQIGELLRGYGYAVAETTHDCGQLGGLAQSRKRFLLVARHVTKVPPFLYEPHKRPLRAVGDVLGRMLLPGAPEAGPMHRVPALQWKTWLRLAMVEAGSDWRSLNRLRVEDGVLADYGIVPEVAWQDGAYGVLRWDGPAGAVTSKAGVSNGRYAVPDPRYDGHAYGQYGVRHYGQPVGAISGQAAPGGGPYAIADPCLPASENRHYTLYRIIRWDQTGGCVTGASHAGNGRMNVADPRHPGAFFGKYAVTSFDDPAGTVLSNSSAAQGAYAVADPGMVMRRAERDAYQTAGHYGVMRWTDPSGAVSAAACHDNGRWSVADERLPNPTANVVAVIRAEDGTWHRPFTTLELAALQGLVDPEEQLEMDGLSDTAWRERIGNAVPPPAATAIANAMGQVLLLAWSGETFSMGSTPIWVRPVAAALMAAQERMS